MFAVYGLNGLTPPRLPVGIDIRQCERTRWGLWQI
ncbi:MAG: hypothetical protein CAPSK01_001097 [Candidatus Accumulibacter vicinus]|uniref:Uncharacterized protein n=1 Tax=Candidatus Accumulibacter vicinus TaxID=2954382 RepID=A0A084Y3Q7_9PROT|nr:MAG: hypothetical protein CAPSK01_001097 [Candidatus Accumulibacter vicinus]